MKQARTTRRCALLGAIISTLASIVVPPRRAATNKGAEAPRIIWRKLDDDETVTRGDFFSSEDPNLVYEPSGSARQIYGLLHAAFEHDIGRQVGCIRFCKDGEDPGPDTGYWRPTALA